MNANDFVKAADAVCSYCIKRDEKTCETCPVRQSVDYYNKPTLTFVYEGDYVLCNNCMKRMIVPTGADVCPECGKTGCMQFVDESKPEQCAADVPNPTPKELPEDYLPQIKEEYLTELAMDFMHNNDCNFISEDIKFELTIFGNPVYPESIWYSDKEDKIYLHCGCPEFEGDLDITQLSDSNQKILIDVFKAHI